MHKTIRGLALAALILPAGGASAQTLTAEWLLNPASSDISLTTTKKGTVVETHHFRTLDGRVGPDGEALVKIDLSSLDTGVDIRNVRMRFLFFEDFKFPFAEISARLDPAPLLAMQPGETVVMPLPVTLDLHGVLRNLTTQAVVLRMSDTQVRVVSSEPVTVLVADHDLMSGLDRLREAVGGIDITPEAKVSFDLTFEVAGSSAGLETARLESEKRQFEETNRALTAEECQNRMVTISETRHIYFNTGSATLNLIESAPVLNEIAQFFQRCPAVRMRIVGHTDSQGGEGFNMALSERRAIAVLTALIDRKVDRGRLQALGLGEHSPVSDNSTEEGRARNRRIEFVAAE